MTISIMGEFLIGFVDVSVGTGGPSGCSRCGVAAQAAAYRAAHDILQDVHAAVSRWAQGSGPNVCLLGAEPFGHPELPSIVTACIAAGVSRLGVETDAVALQSRQNAAGSVAAGLRHVRFFLLAGTPGLHDALTGRAGASDATLAGVRNFRAAAEASGDHISITAVVPVCRHNVSETPSAVGLAVSAGADRVLLQVADSGLGLASSAGWMRAACDTGVVNGAWIEVEGVPFCLMPGYELHVADTVRPRFGTKAPACASCPAHERCGGAAPGTAPDQLAELRPDVVDRRLAEAIARARSNPGAAS